MALKDLPKYKDIRKTIRRKGSFPIVGTAVKDTHVIHHSLTPMYAKGSTPYGFANHHIDTNGWPGIGYHFVIMPDGTIYYCNDLNTRAYHAGNTNTRAIGTCLVGDFRKGKEKPTQQQIESLYRLNKELLKVLPNMKYAKGHQECPGYSWKNCPGDNWNYKLALNGGLLGKGTKAPETPVKSEKLPAKYVIQEGDTFWSIAKELEGITVNEIIKLNPGVDPKRLKVGQTINLIKSPVGGTYTVRKGDTLWGIARAYKGVSVDSIKKANNLKSDLITVGQKLVIPSVSSSKPAPPKKSAPHPTNGKPPASDIGKRVESIYSGKLNFRNKPSWSNKDVVGYVRKGEGFPAITEIIKVENGYQYKVKNSRGHTYYITASRAYVRVVNK